MGRLDRDDGDRRDTVSKRRKRIIETMEEPILPKFCRTWFIVMLVVTAMMVITDGVNFFRFGSNLGWRHLLHNVSYTAFFSWLFFSVFLIPISLWQLYKHRRYFAQQLAGHREGGEETEADILHRRTEAEKPLWLYLRTAGVGLLVTGLLFLLFRQY